MFETVTTLLGIAAAIALAIRFALHLQRDRRKRANAPDVLFAKVKPLIADARYEGENTVGYPQLVGRYRDLPVRLNPVIDTLAIRKLPSLWLLATIPDPLPVRATFDLMMRPAGPTTFSNFDYLPVTLERAPDLPLHAIVRTDDSAHVLPHHVVAPHLDIFEDPRAKELLITPKGLRFVWQAAEADRAHYGVLRQAEFGEVELDPQLVQSLLDRLIALRHAILQWGSTRVTDTPAKPMHPYAILALSIVLPGSGHVFSGVPARGLQFLFFMIVIGWATSKIAPEQASFIGRYAGGVFIYALSILDAYKIARVKWETWRYAARPTENTTDSPNSE